MSLSRGEPFLDALSLLVPLSVSTVIWTSMFRGRRGGTYRVCLLWRRTSSVNIQLLVRDQRYSLSLPPSLPPSLSLSLSLSLILSLSLSFPCPPFLCVSVPTQSEVQSYLRRNNMYVRGRDVPKPCLTFHEVYFPGTKVLSFVFCWQYNYWMCVLCM